ncbi:PIN domain-containing protein [Adhaeretor mobilis]|uniref:tRNA(fMet)-specific endonuclease VapC n=1 Tax=Adhaeretor mobilis TaxID=1930276 RepID=A0A517N2G8_9BACT|nr:PIN domain-containing protein [Adhaeretor mobilis]QDT01198.1 tRNA(fMet)-specific endonuclease VapC [Adhaeretor mobilis]
MNAIDTNILIYAVDTEEPEKSAKAIELLRRLSTEPVPLIVPWQVAVEFLACLRRWENAKRISRSQSQRYLAEFLMPMPIVHPSTKVLQASLELSSRHSLSHWDSLLLAACIEAGVQSLYSEDMSHGGTYDSVQIVNPFC